MIRLALTIVAFVVPVVSQQTLLEARKGHVTKLTRELRETSPLEPPPPKLFALVEYAAPVGKCKAYVSKPRESGKRYPAILWISGGFPPGGMDSAAWTSVDADNDQSAKAYREAGVVTMYPTFRGSHGNPGFQETFFGEIDDALAAVEYLRQVEWVDPSRVWVGGHSTGGTMALLIAAATDKVKGVISFGPSTDADYGADNATFETSDEKELRLRSPIEWLDGIKVQTFLIEGTIAGNLDSLRAMESATKNPMLSFLAIKDADHFNLLAPINKLVAGRIAKLVADQPLVLPLAELEKSCADQRAQTLRARDDNQLAAIRKSGVEVNKPQVVGWVLASESRSSLVGASEQAKAQGFVVQPIGKSSHNGTTWFVLVVSKKLVPSERSTLFAASLAVSKLAAQAQVQDTGWDVR